MLLPLENKIISNWFISTDLLIWPHDHSSLYSQESLASPLSMLRWKNRTQRYGSQMWAALWRLELTFKFLISFGKLRNDCLPLSRELRIRNLITDNSCPSCAIEEECLGHQFITYNLTCVTCFRSPLTIRRYLS